MIAPNSGSEPKTTIIITPKELSLIKGSAPSAVSGPSQADSFKPLERVTHDDSAQADDRATINDSNHNKERAQNRGGRQIAGAGQENEKNHVVTAIW